MLRFRIFAALAALCCLAAFPAGAEIAFPASLTEIGAEAYALTPMPASLTLPDSLVRIGEGAFRDCASLRKVTIPDSVTQIGEGAFSGCGEALLISCSPGSAALAHARANSLDYSADTVCRLLSVGLNYSGSSRPLYGTSNDARAISFCLGSLAGTACTTTLALNLSAADLLARISTVFSAADDTDISVFYYSGHGEADGSLVGQDGALITPAALRSALDAVPGRKVVIVDACYSGQLIAEGTRSRGGGAASFVSAFQSAFRSTSRGALNGGSYFVLTAARPEEESSEGYISSASSGRYMGYFTCGICRGLGWDGVANTSCTPAADANADGAISIHEAWGYARSWALNQNENQHASVWPADCRWFAPFRTE